MQECILLAQAKQMAVCTCTDCAASVTHMYRLGILSFADIACCIKLVIMLKLTRLSEEIPYTST